MIAARVNLPKTEKGFIRKRVSLGTSRAGDAFFVFNPAWSNGSQKKISEHVVLLRRQWLDSITPDDRVEYGDYELSGTRPSV